MDMWTPLSPIPEGKSMPDLPGKDVNENDVMLPKFLLALAQLPGATSESSNLGIWGWKGFYLEGCNKF